MKTSNYYLTHINPDNLETDLHAFISLLLKANLPEQVIILLIIFRETSAHSYSIFKQMKKDLINQYYFNYINYKVDNTELMINNPFQNYYKIISKLYSTELSKINIIIKKTETLNPQYKFLTIYLPPL